MKIKLLPLVVIFFFSCDKDPMIKGCCGSPYIGTSDFTLYIPSAFTPDGDHLNDNFRMFIGDDKNGVRLIEDFEVRDSRRRLIYSKALYYSGSQSSTPAWDFTDDRGMPTFGKLSLKFKLTDKTGKVHNVSHTICVINCPYFKVKNISVDFSECVFEDQLDPQRGFINVTGETAYRCP